MLIEKGWTIIFLNYDDLEGKETVAKRCKTTKEKDEFLEKIYSTNSGWLPEELQTVCSINDYNYIPLR